MLDAANEMFLVAAIPVTIVVVSIIYTLGVVYLETRDTCKHSWSRWSDIRKDDGHPYQLRLCHKCNLHEQKLVQ